MQEAASSTPIKARAVFSFKIKFFIHLMDSGVKGHLPIFKEGCGKPEGEATTTGAVETAHDGATLVNESSQRLLVLSGMAPVASLLSLWAGTILPLSGGYSMTASSFVRSMVVTPQTLGLRFNMRAGSAQTYVMCVHKVSAALLTSISI